MSVDPVELQVILGALRAACEEMGAVLIRSAHSANIKERRDASTALFDAAGEMVMQAEHIPVHLGAMPAAVAAVRDEAHAPGRAWVLNDPYAGGTHLPDITVVTPVFASGELLGFAASRAHHADVGGPTPGSMPADSRTLADEGVVIEPQPLDEAAIERARRADAPARRSAAPTCAPSWPPTAPARCGSSELADRSGRRDAARGDGRGARLRRAAHARVHRRAARTACARRATCWRRAEGDLELRLRATRRGRAARARLLRQRRPARRQPQLPARRHALGLLLRRARADRPRHPAERRRLPADRGARARRARCSTRARRRRSSAGNVETSSRVADLVLAAFGRALGQGTMNNLTLGNERLHLLRDDRRRAGRVPGRRRPERRARRDEQHAQHADRGARAGVPAARDGVRAAARHRAAPARHRGGDGVVRELEALAPMTLLAADRAPPPRAARRRRRRARRAAGATCSTASAAAAQGARRARSPGSGCGSRRPAAAGTASAGARANCVQK